MSMFSMFRLRVVASPKLLTAYELGRWASMKVDRQGSGAKWRI